MRFLSNGMPSKRKKWRKLKSMRNWPVGIPMNIWSSKPPVRSSRERSITSSRGMRRNSVWPLALYIRPIEPNISADPFKNFHKFIPRMYALNYPMKTRRIIMKIRSPRFSQPWKTSSRSITIPNQGCVLSEIISFSWKVLHSQSTNKARYQRTHMKVEHWLNKCSQANSSTKRPSSIITGCGINCAKKPNHHGTKSWLIEFGMPANRFGQA